MKAYNAGDVKTLSGLYASQAVLLRGAVVESEKSGKKARHLTVTLRFDHGTEYVMRASDLATSLCRQEE